MNNPHVDKRDCFDPFVPRNDGELFLLPLRLIERQLHHLRRRVLAMMIHRDLHSHIRAEFIIRLLQMCERDVLLQQRRPTCRGRIPHLHIANQNRHTRTDRGPRHLRRQTDLGIQLLHADPIDLDAHHLPRRAFALLFFQRLAPDKITRLIQRYCPIESQLERRRLLRTRSTRAPRTCNPHRA